MSSKATSEELQTALDKALSKGVLHRLPKHPGRRDILLAVISQALERRYPYHETELNNLLQQVLAKFNAEVDHVTCRRYLVDLGFVKRDRAGTRYFLNFPKLEATLSSAAMADSDAIRQTVITEQSKPKPSYEEWQRASKSD